MKLGLNVKNVPIVALNLSNNPVLGWTTSWPGEETPGSVVSTEVTTPGQEIVWQIVI